MINDRDSHGQLWKQLQYFGEKLKMWRNQNTLNNKLGWSSKENRGLILPLPSWGGDLPNRQGRKYLKLENRAMWYFASTWKFPSKNRTNPYFMVYGLIPMSLGRFHPLNSLNNQGSFHCSVVAVTKHARSTFPVVQVEENIGPLHTNEKRKWHPIWKSWVWSSSHSEFWWGFIFLKCAMTHVQSFLEKTHYPEMPLLCTSSGKKHAFSWNCKCHDPRNPPQPKTMRFFGT